MGGSSVSSQPEDPSQSSYSQKTCMFRWIGDYIAPQCECVSMSSDGLEASPGFIPCLH